MIVIILDSSIVLSIGHPTYMQERVPYDRVTANTWEAQVENALHLPSADLIWRRAAIMMV